MAREVAATCSSMGIPPELVVEAICSSRLLEVANCTHVEEVEGICSSMGTSRELEVVGICNGILVVVVTCIRMGEVHREMEVEGSYSSTET